MIEAIELTGLRLSSDGTCLRLRVRDETGQTITVSLPVGWLNALQAAVPGTCEPDTVHILDSWSMDRVGNGQDLVLTLRTPAGLAVSFAMKNWQVEGMATIATYGTTGRSSPTTLH